MHPSSATRSRLVRTLRTSVLAAATTSIAVAAAPDGPIEELTVHGTSFVAEESLSGTKTDTPLIETAQSISIISRDLLSSWNPGKFTEALRYTPGLQPEPFGVEPRFSNIRLRGFDAATTGFFRDGLLLANPGFAVSYNLVPYGAERVEIPRGPVSVLYGQGSPGGLVNYISKTPGDESFGEVGIEYGNHQWREGHFDAQLAGDAFSGRLVGLMRDSETQIDFVEDDRTYLAPSLRWTPGERTTLTVHGSYQQDRTANSQALPAAGTVDPNPNGSVPIERFTGEPGFDEVEREEYSVGYLFEHRFSDDLILRERARFNRVELDDRVVFSNGLNPDQRTISRGAFGNFGDLDGFTVDTHLQWNLDWGDVRHKLLFGIDYQDIEATSTQQSGAAPDLDVFDPDYGATITLPPPFLDNEIELGQLGFYIQDEIRFADRFVLNLAARLDDAESETFSNLTGTETADQDDTEMTYRAGLVYLADGGFAPYFSYSESFLPSAGTDAAGNAFEPETARQIEVGVKYQPERFDGLFTLALFDVERQDFVARDENFVSFQTGQASSRGVELEAYLSLEPGLDLIANYNYLDTEVEDHPNPAVEGNEFTQIPEHKFSLWLKYEFPEGPLQGLGLGAGLRHQSESFSDDLNTFESPDFTLGDAALYYEWQDIRLALNVQNITDKEYSAACFQRISALCTFGETRTIRGSLTYRW